MRKRSLMLYIVCVLFFASALLGTTNTTMTTLLEDPQNDVYELYSGTTDSFYPEIDIKAVYLNNSDLMVEMWGTPQINSDCWYNVYINNDSNINFEFWLQCVGGNARLSDYDEVMYWDDATSQWVVGYKALPFSIVGNALVFKNVALAIPNIGSSGISLTNDYTGEYPICYRDTADKVRRIPGFTWVPLLLGLLSSIMLVLFLRSQKFNL